MDYFDEDDESPGLLTAHDVSLGHICHQRALIANAVTSLRRRWTDGLMPVVHPASRSLFIQVSFLSEFY